MNYRLLTLLFNLVLAGVFNAKAQYTFSQDVAPLIYDHCTKCHREGEIGPMPLTNYAEVVDYAAAIVYEISTGHMPPWSPDPEYVSFVGQNVLSDDEIEVIHQWYLTGMAQGNPELEPELPVFPEGSQIGVPDLVISMDQAYLHEGDYSDQYQVFVLPVNLQEDKDIKAIEVRPGNSSIAHHAILALDTTSTAIGFDALDPDYGYESFGGFQFEPTNSFWTAWVPGTSPQVYPDFIGTKLWANSKILLQMHYGPTEDDQEDLTSINIFYADEPVSRYAITFPMSPYDLDESFFIPANTVKTFHGTLEVPVDLSLMGIAPHCHLLGQSWEVYATFPGEDTIPLISIPDWNFHHQGFYTYPNLVHIPTGYTVHCIGTYDNTINNPDNPNNPPQWVTWGEGTEDEMYLCYFTVIPYNIGDEEISLSQEERAPAIISQENRLFYPYPNPASRVFSVNFGIAKPGSHSLYLFDIEGRRVKTLVESKYYAPGLHTIESSTDDLNNGQYILQMIDSDGNIFSRPLLIID